MDQQHWKTLCDTAWELGKDLELSECGYGQSHTVYGHVLGPLKHYYFLGGFCKAIGARNILEIGTHFGGSICSMNKAVQTDNIVTIDIQEHNELPKNIKRIRGGGEFPSTYVGLRKLFDGKLDLVFVDGVHSLRDTKKYLEHCLKLRPRFMIFDDINLNEEMRKFWKHVSVRYDAYDCSEESRREDNCGLGVIHLR